LYGTKDVLKLSWGFLLVAMVTAAIGGRAAGLVSDIAIVLFLLFGLLYVAVFVVKGRGRVALGMRCLVGLAGVGLLALAFSDRYSLEGAGAEFDAALAEARADFGGFVDALPDVVRRDASSAYETARDEVKILLTDEADGS
jgi:hypothetical protein